MWREMRGSNFTASIRALYVRVCVHRFQWIQQIYGLLIRVIMRMD